MNKPILLDLTSFSSKEMFNRIQAYKKLGLSYKIVDHTRDVLRGGSFVGALKTHD